MGYELRQVQRHSYICSVCRRETLPARNTGEAIQDPSDPERFAICVLCDVAVPRRMQKSVGYQRRWDGRNAQMLFEECGYLKQRVAELEKPEPTPAPKDGITT